MSQKHTPIARCEVPNIDLLPNREARRKFKSGKYVNTIIAEIDRIDVGGGTEKNTARSEGTDTVHTDALVGEFGKGIRYDQLPPIVVKIGAVYKLIDGFTRISALKIRKQESWVFDVYELEEGYSLEDLEDEIGLGANNHAQAKKATRDDFITKGILWVKRQGNRTVSKVEIKGWINNIEHTFTNDQVNTITDRIFDKAYPDTSVATFSEAKASEYLQQKGYASKGKFNEDGLHGRTFAATANATHGPRNFCHILRDFKESGKRTRVNLFAPNGTKAKDVEKMIEDQKREFIELAEAIQEMAILIKADKNWMPFEFGVRPSQLVNIDPDGGVVKL